MNDEEFNRRVDEFDKKVFHWLMVIFVSVVTSLCVCTAYGRIHGEKKETKSAVRPETTIGVRMER